MCIRDSNEGDTNLNRNGQYLATADDVAIVARNIRDSEETYTTLERAAQSIMGVKTNLGKIIRLESCRNNTEVGK